MDLSLIAKGGQRLLGGFIVSVRVSERQARAEVYYWAVPPNASLGGRRKI